MILKSNLVLLSGVIIVVSIMTILVVISNKSLDAHTYQVTFVTYYGTVNDTNTVTLIGNVPAYVSSHRGSNAVSCGGTQRVETSAPMKVLQSKQIK